MAVLAARELPPFWVFARQVGGGSARAGEPLRCGGWWDLSRAKVRSASGGGFRAAITCAARRRNALLQSAETLQSGLHRRRSRSARTAIWRQENGDRRDACPTPKGQTESGEHTPSACALWRHAAKFVTQTRSLHRACSRWWHDAVSATLTAARQRRALPDRLLIRRRSSRSARTATSSREWSTSPQLGGFSKQRGLSCLPFPFSPFPLVPPSHLLIFPLSPLLPFPRQPRRAVPLWPRLRRAVRFNLGRRRKSSC